MNTPTTSAVAQPGMPAGRGGGVGVGIGVGCGTSAIHGIGERVGAAVGDARGVATVEPQAASSRTSSSEIRTGSSITAIDLTGA